MDYVGECGLCVGVDACAGVCGWVYVGVKERDVKTLTKLDFLLTMTDEKLYAFVFLGDNFFCVLVVFTKAFVCWVAFCFFDGI